MPVAVELANPWWLLALPPLAVFLVVARLPWWKGRSVGWRLRVGFRSRRQRPTSNFQHSTSNLQPRTSGFDPRASNLQPAASELRRLAFRLAWASLLVLALAGATLTRPLFRQATVFVLDASASTAAVRDQAEAAVRAAADQRPGGDLVGVVATAAGARVEEGPVAEPLFARLAAALPASASDLSAGLRLAAALLPEGYTGRVVLVSDGRQTRGDAVAAARDLAAQGVTVDVLPIGAAAEPDVRVESVDLAETAYQGEVATLVVRLHATQAATAALRVYRDDEVVRERRVELRSGRQEVALAVPVGEPGLHRYRVDVAAGDPAADATTANNALGAVQRVVGPPRALIVADQPDEAGLLPAAFRAGGAEVDVVGPPGLPADLAGWARYDVVVLADVAARALPGATMDLLEQYVRDLGRGLVMTGGPDSFGPGGYAETPLERALPVYMDVRGRGRQPRVALVLVIDKSGSMGGLKMELAKEAAVRSLRLLRPDDQAAVVAFDSVPQWVAPLTSMSERARLEQAIGGVYAGGGTEIYPAVAAGFAALRDVEADVKHVILMTDGHSGSGGDYGRLLREMEQARISLSAVAVGEDADAGLLQAMARAGRGRYHFAADPASIPEIFAQETVMATRTILVDARFYPAAASASPLLRGLTAVPPLDGYVAVTPKERAEVALVSPEGDPILAAWQYGVGRAVAWTPDVAGRWSAAWAKSAAATTLWGSVLSWLLPAQAAGDLSVRVEADADGGAAVAAETDSGWEEVRPTRATLIGPSGQRQEIDLAPAGPGRYRGSLGAPEPGAYLVQVRQTSASGAELRGETGWVAPYPEEYRETGVDRPLLARVAEAGGGRLLTDPAEAVAPAARPAVARWPLTGLLLALAALCWPLEIAARRLALSSLVVRLPQWRGRAAVVSAASVAISSANATPPPPAAETAQRLLERKRALRERQR